MRGYVGATGALLAEPSAQPAETCWCQQATVGVLPVLGGVLALLLLLDRWSRGRSRRLATSNARRTQKHGGSR